MWQDLGSVNSWSHICPQQTGKSLVQHGMQASRTGIPSGIFLHLWLRFELFALIFLVMLESRWPADCSVTEASCQWKPMTALYTIIKCRQDLPHWTTLPVWLHIIKNRELDFFFYKKIYWDDAIIGFSLKIICNSLALRKGIFFCLFFFFVTFIWFSPL